MWFFKPILKSLIWGGETLKDFKQIESTQEKIGESWELSGVKGSETTVAEGPDSGLTVTELIARHGASLMGEKNYLKYGDSFPLLIKFIDAARDLSIQVHPDDELARKRGSEFGKTEMWHILDAKEGAKLAFGFNKKINPEDYKNKICSKEIMDNLNFHLIKKGDTFFIPAGRVHAIGAGTLLVEIQQSSDTTYRLYDYGRLDADGKERKLHHEEAFEALDFNDVNPQPVAYQQKIGHPVNLVTDPRFTVNLWTIDDEVVRDYSEWDTFIIVIALEGMAQITAGGITRKIKKGETVLIPASFPNLKIVPEGKFKALEAYIK